MEIKKMTGEEIEKLVLIDRYEDIYTMELVEKYGHIKFDNFRYFSPQHLFETTNHGDCTFIVAFENDKIIGVIKLGLYGYEGDETYIGMNYIDVHKDYKNQKIATKMIQFLDTQLDSSMKLYLSSMSDEGRKCNIHDVFKRNIFSTSIITR